MTRNESYNRIARFYAEDKIVRKSPRAHAGRIARDRNIERARVNFTLEDVEQGGYLHLFVDGVEVEVVGPMDIKR